MSPTSNLCVCVCVHVHTCATLKGSMQQVLHLTPENPRLILGFAVTVQQVDFLALKADS